MSSKIWFQKSDITLFKPIILDDLHGYILPHASTKYTGHILSHTLKFRPKNDIKIIIIIYYPAFDKENIIVGSEKYYHEYYVPWQTMLIALSFWNIDQNSITIIPVNARDTTNKLNIKYNKNVLLVVSSDFSHFLPFEEAIVKENTAAHALMYKNTDPKFMNNIVDDPRSYKYLFSKILSKDITLQWIGRTRSPGLKAVGYLSFLLIKQHKVNPSQLPDGIFVTCYDTEMRHRECLGNWFKNDSNKYSKKEETELIKKVILLGQTESRLTGCKNIEPLIKYYTVSYLYKSQTNKNNNFIRGWHTVLGNATYLSDVFLENTFNNGEWINLDLDTEWPSNNNDNNNDNNFDMTETLEQLNLKANLFTKTPITLYDTFVKNVTMSRIKIKKKTRKNR
jgi:hypothetical protein